MQTPSIPPQFGEEIRCLVGFIDEMGFGILVDIPFRDLVEGLLHEEIGQAGPLLAVKSPPVLTGADDIFGLDFAQLFQGLVPV